MEWEEIAVSSEGGEGDMYVDEEGGEVLDDMEDKDPENSYRLEWSEIMIEEEEPNNQLAPAPVNNPADPSSQ